MSSPMHPLVKIGHQPHPMDEKYQRPYRRRYGRPRVALYYANRTRFTDPGLYLWTGKRNVRILPLPRRRW